MTSFAEKASEFGASFVDITIDQIVSEFGAHRRMTSLAEKASGFGAPFVDITMGELPDSEPIGA